MTDNMYKRSYGNCQMIERHVKNGTVRYDTWSSMALDKRVTVSGKSKNPKDSSGWRQPSSYSVTDDSIEGWYGTVLVKNRWRDPYANDRNATDVQWVGFYPGFDDLPLVIDPQRPTSNDSNRALISALGKVKDMKINLAQAFAERLQTANLLADNVTRLLKAYSYGRKGRWKQVLQTLGIRKHRWQKDASGRWLEVQYGWLPLLSDIHGAYEQITKPSKRLQGMRFKVASQVAVGKIAGEMSDKYGRWSGGYSSEAYVKYNLWFEVTSAELLLASQVGLTDPLTIAWELTPWSFVIDWIVPVGDVLEAMNAVSSGVTFHGGTVVKWGETKAWGGLIPYKVEGGTTIAEVTGGCRATRRHVWSTREAFTKLPPIGPQNLFVKNPFSGMHLANAIALLRGRFR